MAREIHFLLVEEVIDLHDELLAQYGGRAGIKNLGLLEAAVAAPQAAVVGAYLHEGLIAMAAAYLFHIVLNHGFQDGNKRAGAAAMTTFLEMNGFETDFEDDELVEIAVMVAAGSMRKDALTLWLRKRLNTR